MIKIGKYQIRPEIEKFSYWLHILILALIVQFILNYLFKLNLDYSIINTLKFLIAISSSDILAHSLLKLN